MKNYINLLLASAALSAVGEAKWNACGLNDYQLAMMSFNQGFQKDIIKVDSDCMAQTIITMTTARTFFNSFYYYSYEDFLAPIYHFANVGTDMTNIMYNCQTINFAKQLSIRTSSWGGLIEMLLTLTMAFVKNAAQPGKSELYNSFSDALSANSCARTGRAIGHCLSLIVSVETSDVIYVEDLNFSLADYDEEYS